MTDIPAAPPDDEPRRRRDTRLRRWAGPVVGMVAALILVLPVFGARPPAGEDVMAHLVRADVGIPLVTDGRLDGWFPRFFLGHQLFLFNGPGLTWLLALVRGVTFGALSNTGALKVVCIASFVAMPPAVCFLARSYGLGRRAAGLAAVLAVAVSNPFGVGLEGLFAVGLVSHQVGAVFFCVALGACVRILRAGRAGTPGAPGAGRWVAVLAGSLAALVVTHLISALILAVAVALTAAFLAVAGRLRPVGLAHLVAAGAGAAGLAGFWVVPLLAHHDLRGTVTTWGTPPIAERLGRIASGDVLLPAGVAWVVLAGWLWRLRRLDRDPGALAWVALPAAYLLVAHGSVGFFRGNEITMQLANRGLGYAGLVAMFSVAGLLAAGSRRWGTRGHVAVVAAVAAAAVAVAPGRDAAGQLPEPVPAMRAAAAELARLVPDGARFATQRDFPGEIRRTGVVHPEIWLARVSGRNSLNGFNVEASSTPRAAFAADDLDEDPPGRSADRMARFGVTHVVTTADDLAERLVGSGRFERVWRSAPLTILAVQGRPGQPEPAAGLTGDVPFSARRARVEAEHLVFDVVADRPLHVTMALAWSPKWHGRVDGTETELGRTGDGLVRLPLPSGPSRVEIRYRPDVWDRAGVAVTLLTGALALGAARTRGRRRDRPSQPMSRSFSRTA